MFDTLVLFRQFIVRQLRIRQLIIRHENVAPILHRLIINCQYQKRQRCSEEPDTDKNQPGPKDDPPPAYELPPTYKEAVRSACHV
jgi:hypothetical protein